jgi:hypothetical protein
VAEARKYIFSFGDRTRRTAPDSARENCQLIGFDPDSYMGGPWGLSEGNVSSLKMPDTAIVYRLYFLKQILYFPF